MQVNRVKGLGWLERLAANKAVEVTRSAYTPPRRAQRRDQAGNKCNVQPIDCTQPRCALSRKLPAIR